MKPKRSTSSALPEGFVRSLDTYAEVTRELLTDRNLTGEELRLLIFLMTHDLPDARNHGLRKGYVYLSRATLASNFNRSTRQISNLVSGLETKGYVRREFQKGLVNVIQLLKGPPLEHDTLAENLQGSDSLLLQESFNTPLQKTCKGPLKKTFNQKNRIEEENKKSRKSTDPNVRLLTDHFCSEYEKAIGHKYSVSGGRDGQICKDLLKDHSLETLKNCIALFLTDRDSWLDGKRTIPVLRSRINQYVQHTSSGSEAPVPAAYRKLQ